MTGDSLKKILLVDDEKEILTDLGYVLQQAGYDVVSTPKGKEAVDLAQDFVPDLIVLDLVIPDMLGGDVARVLSELPATSDIPIIFLSGLNTKEDAQIIREKTGNYHIVAKPVTPEELLAVISKVLKNSKVRS